MGKSTEFRVEREDDAIRLQLVGRSVFVSRMPDGPWLVTVTPGRSYELQSVNEVNDFVTGMACGDIYGTIIGEIARVHVISRSESRS